MKNLAAIILNCTSRCNLNCYYCAAKEFTDELDRNSIEKILNSTIELKTYYLMIAGGEPLLRSDIYDILDHANKLGLVIILMSNGTLINKYIAKKLKDIGVDAVRLTLDSTEEYKIDKIKGSGAYRKILMAINYLNHEGIGVNLNIPISYDNINEIEQFLNFAINNNIRTLRFSPIIKKDLNVEICEILLRQILVLHEKYNENISYIDYEPINELDEFYEVLGNLRCTGGRMLLNVNPDGSITKCPYVRRSLGNIKENELKEIWIKSYFNTKSSSICEVMKINLAVLLGNIVYNVKEVSIETIRKVVSAWYFMIKGKEEYCLRDLPLWYINLR
ncbi:radical SAM/SPASM domain-containing protein [Dictyoglomus thermophilum]|nr:radical SAM protein [Dictyoglomus thermophilum]